MKEVKIEKCPFCGGEEMLEVHVCSYGGVTINLIGKLRSVPLFATVCRDCGSLVRTYCKNPENLFPKKQRKEQD